MTDKPQKPSKPSDHIDEKATEKEASNPDVAKDSQTDAKGKIEINKKITNPSSGSEGFDRGLTAIRFEITDGAKTIASKDVKSEQSDDSASDSASITLTGVLKVIKEEGDKEQSELAQNIEVMRTQAKEKGISTEAIDEYAKETFSKPANKEEQFKRGAHQALSPDQIDNQNPLDPNDKPEGGYEQEKRTDGGIILKGVIPGEIDNNWQNIVERISELPIDKQFQIIGTGLQAFNDELNRQKLEIAVGTVEGIGEGFKSLGDGVVSLANGLGQIGQFSADVMTNNPRALETGAQAGEAIGKTLVGGVRLFQMSHDYLYNIGFTGDYSKPFKDVASLGDELDRRWQEMPTKERAKIAAKLSTETLASMAIPLGANKLAKTEKVTELMEEFAVQAKALGKESDAVKAIQESVDTLTKKGGRAMELGGDLVTNVKRKIHDRRHLTDIDDLARIASGFDVKIENMGASPGFMAKLERIVDGLDPHERIFLADSNIEIVGCKTIKSIRPKALSNTAGSYVRAENKIYIPEKVFAQELENPAVEFHLRHEFGHAFNDHSVFQDPFSDSKAFRGLYKEIYDQLPEETRHRLRITRSYKEWEELGGANGGHYDPAYSRHEIFADLYAHITGIGARTEYSEILEIAFGDGCSDHIRNLVIDYMKKIRDTKRR